MMSEDKLRTALMDREMVVFDMDGTLFDLPVNWEGLKEEMCAMMGEHRNVDGGFIMSAYNHARGDPDLRKRMVDLQAEYELKDIRKSTRVEEGISCAEWRLKRGLKCSVFSMNTARAIESLIGGMGFYPVVTIDSVRMPKPDPEGLIMLKEMKNIDGGSMAFVGNTSKDQMAAAGAKVDYIDVSRINREWFK